MSPATIATDIFASLAIAIALFLFVLCLTGLVGLGVIGRSRHGGRRGAFEQESTVRGLMLLKSWLSATQLQS